MSGGTDSSKPNGTSPGKGGFIPPSTADLDAILDQYEFLDLLGRGGMGAVYKARQKSLDRLVAIKILPPHLTSDAEEQGFHFAERFQREAKAMAKLSHPHIVGVHDFGQARDGQFYFVMEYIEGTDLSALIKGGQLTTAHVAGWMSQICEALQYAHDKGIVHRDIKPANIMITREGQVKVADFGLAKLGSDGAEQTKLTMTNMAMGTPDYVAPEALEIGVEVDHRADLYALGVMLYEMLTGRVPRGAWKMPSAQVEGLDPRYDALIERAMDSDRESRFQKAAEISATIYEIATTQPPGASRPKLAMGTAPSANAAAAKERTRPQPPAPAKGKAPAPRAASKSPVGLIVGLAGGAVAVGLTTFLIFKSKDPEPAVAPSPPASQAAEQRIVAPTPPPAPVTTPDPVPAVPAPKVTTPSPSPVVAHPNTPPAAPIPFDTAGWTDLLATADVARDTISGKWERTSGGLLLQNDGRHVLLEFQPPPSEEYDYLIEFTVPGKETTSFSSVSQVFVASGQPLALMMRGDRCFLGPLLDGMDQNNPDRPADASTPALGIEGGRPVRALLEVRRGGIRVLLDDREIIQWSGDTSRLKLHSSYRLRDRTRLAIGAQNANVVFRRALVRAAPGTQSASKAGPTPATTATPGPEPVKPATPLTNSLGMSFVPVPGTDLLLCVHETRRQDYAAYAAAVPGVDESWKRPLVMKKALPAEDDHPVCLVSWEDTFAFCRWLSQKEGRHYRLPTEHEWNLAVAWDLPNPESISEEGLSKWIAGQNPWGKAAEDQSGNFASSGDPYPGTAPVMSFPPNQHGFHDLGGNVWEWCDNPAAGPDRKVMRGCGFLNFGGYRRSGVQEFAPSSFRVPQDNDTNRRIVGFRVLIDPKPAPAPESMTSAPPASAPVSPPAVPSAPADPVSVRLVELEKAYQAAYATQVGAVHEQAVADLNAKYGAALDRAIAAASQAGKLDEALALRDEKTLVQAQGRVPEQDDAGLPAAIATLRKTWRTAHAPLLATRDRNAAPLLPTYERALAAYQDELTRAQNLDGAARVKAVRDRITSGEAPSSAGAAKAPDVIGSRPGETPKAPSAPPLSAAEVLPPLPKASAAEIRALCEWALTLDGIELDLVDSSVPFTVKKGQALPKGAFKLVGFRLDRYNIAGRFPMEGEGLKHFAVLGRAPDLETLEFVSSTESFPIELLRGATNLKILEAGAAIYDEKAFAHLGGLKKLERVKIMMQVQQFTGLGLGYLPEELQEIYLDSPSLTVEGMAYLSRFKKLRVLSFDDVNVYSRCNVTDAMLTGLSSLRELEKLNLSGCPVDGSFLASLPPNSKLKEIELYQTKTFDPRHFPLLAKLTQLETFKMPNVTIESSTLALLAKLDQLEELLINENPQFSGEQFVGVKGFRNLAYLDVSLSPITDTGLNAIGEALPGLKRIHLASRDNAPLPATAAGFAAFVALVPDLESLDLSGPSITNEWTTSIGNLPKMGYLILFGTAIDDAGLPPLQHLPLGFMRLSGSKITDASIPLLKTFPKLSSVHTDGTGITPAGRAELDRFFRSR
jgi:serine/threonine protein kinase